MKFVLWQEINSHTSAKAMQEMLTPIRESNVIVTISMYHNNVIGSGDGVVKALRSNPALTSEQLEEILVWKDEGCTMNDIVTRLRQRTVPKDFNPHTW